MMATASDIECDRRRDDGHATAQPLDVDAVGHLEDVGHVVADEDDRQALVAHVADELEDLLDSLTPRAAVGSSMMTTRWPKAAARATATPWRCPPESVSTAWLMSWMVSRPSSLICFLAASRMPPTSSMRRTEPRQPGTRRSRPRKRFVEMSSAGQTARFW